MKPTRLVEFKTKKNSYSQFLLLTGGLEFVRIEYEEIQYKQKSLI